MGSYIVEHEVFGKVLFDTSTQQYEYLPIQDYVKFKYKDKSAPFFDSFLEFIESGINIGIVPVVCVESAQKGRRWFVELMDINNYNFKFFNVEMIDSKWRKNKVENVRKNKCYFALMQNDIKAMNDCRLISTMKIKKGNE